MKKIIIFSIVTLLCSAGAYAQNNRHGNGSGTIKPKGPTNAQQIIKGLVKTSEQEENPDFQQKMDSVYKKSLPPKGKTSTEDPKIGWKDMLLEESNPTEPTQVQQIDLLNDREEIERKKREKDVAQKQKELNDLYQEGLAKYDEVEKADNKRKQYNPTGKSDKDIEDEIEQLDREYYDLQWEYDSIKLKYNELVKEYIPS